MKRWPLVFALILTLLIPLSSSAQRRRGRDIQMSADEKALADALNAPIRENWHDGFETLFPTRTTVQQVEMATEELKIHFSAALSYMPLRPSTVQEVRQFIKPLIPDEWAGKPMVLLVGDTQLDDLVPPAYRETGGEVASATPYTGLPQVRPVDLPGPAPTQGLDNKHLAISASHGWMYDTMKSFRWEWQRGRIFNTVEDMHSISYIVPTLIPMLERAGANIFYLRERDWQTHEVVVDDEGRYNERSQGRVKSKGFWQYRRDETGFRNGLAPYPDAFNPHKAGSVHVKKTSNRPYAKFEWIPNIPETGEYGVYVSYNGGADRAPDARYTVYHLGGQTTFSVNQQMGGNTWIWLGRFKFEAGSNARQGRVELSNYSDFPGTTVSADAVKFGGGMGSIERGGKTSGYPRYLEAARYWLQYAGADPDLTYKMGFDSGYEGPDYTDDFSSRAEWANFLRGAPYGPNKDRNNPGLGVPIDLMYSFHTDAGISDGIVGTLMIYYTKDQEGNDVLPDGRSRLTNRELGDLIQTQIVDDVRSLYSSTWSRRQLRDGNYSESRRGNVPSCLIEMMSHQNFNDMKYGLDPRFQWDVSRATYKGILRYLARIYGFDPVVQPLAPTHLMVRQSGPREVSLRWRAQNDPLEPSAKPTGYIVYRRENDGGFDNGTFTERQGLTVRDLEPGTIYSFRVEAVNTGGRSFPSETLAVEIEKDSAKKALIVYGFDRISGADTVDEPNYKGFVEQDRGVGRDYYFGRSGFQYDFDPSLKFVSNDATGHGATSGEMEDKLERGNTFDYVARHGQAFVDNGWTFDSASDDAVAAGMIDLEKYAVVDWVLGEQRTVQAPAGFIEAGTADRMQPMFKTFTPAMQAALIDYATAGGSLLVSGAYVGTDLAESVDNPRQDKIFLQKILHVNRVTNHGSGTNELIPQVDGLFDGLSNLHFAKGLEEDDVYGVELPDAIDPVKDSGGKTVLRYADRRFSAGVMHKAEETGARTLVFGFPFETLVGQEARAAVLARSLEFLAGE